MKKNFSPIVLIALTGVMVVGGVAGAATDATVTATVTVQNISMTLSQSSFAYGTMAANTASSTLTLFGGAGIVATNDGNVTSDFDIYGADTANWTLGATTDSDQYIHKFCNDTDNDCTLPGGAANYTALTTSPATLKNSVASSGTTAFQLQITAPNPSTVYTEQSVGVTVQISAS